MISIALQVLKDIAKEGQIVPVDLQELKTLKSKGFSFYISAWDIGDIRISSISMNGMLGLMKMDSCIITARDHDMPLYSADYVKVPKKKTLLVEMYDTCLGYDMSEWLEKGKALKSQFAGYGDYPRQKRWYDSQLLEHSLAKRDPKLDTAAIVKIINQYTAFYTDWYRNSPSCSREQKLAKTSEYVNNLLAQGGASTDQFKTMFGEEMTEDLFKILFGVD